jgi:SNF2 family DNA or RNA helicase
MIIFKNILVMDQWIEEIKNWTNFEIKPLKFHNEKLTKKSFQKLKDDNIVITTYEVKK